MTKNVLLCGEAGVPIADIFKYLGLDWEIETVGFSRLLKELRTGKYQALLLDVTAPPAFDGQGEFADIGRNESHDGDLMASLLALRLRSVYPDLPIVVLGDAVIGGGKDGADLAAKCVQKNVHLVEITKTREVANIVNGEIAAQR